MNEVTVSITGNGEIRINGLDAVFSALIQKAINTIINCLSENARKGKV